MLVNQDNFGEALSRLTSRRLVVDSETTGLHPWDRKDQPAARPAGWAVRSGEFAAYFPVRHAVGENITGEQKFRLMKKFESAGLLVGHNMGFDENQAREDGCREFPQTVDTMTGAALYNENAPKGLKEFSDRHLEKGSSDEKKHLHEKLRSMKLKIHEMWRLSPAEIAPYAIKDVELTDRLDAFVRAGLYRESMYDELCVFSQLLAKLTRRGMPVCLDTLNARREEAFRESDRVLKALQDAVGSKFNPNSPPQVKAVLKTLDAQEGTLLACKHPLAPLILEFKAWNKAVTTYYNKYELEVDPKGRVHGGLNPVGTVSGRITHSSPNFGAVPRWNEAQKVKDVFVAPPGKVMIEADFSQAEPRIIAHKTQDPRMLEIFENGLDLHSAVAADLGVTRQVGKTMNLSIIYGIGAKTLSERLGVRESVAAGHLHRYYSKFPGVRDLMTKAERTARNVGHIVLYSGRRRHFNCIEAPTHKAFSNLIQGDVAEMVRRTMVRVDQELPEFEMLLQVHDSLIGLADERDADRVAGRLQEIMEDQPWSSVRMKVDVKTGPSWGLMKERGK